MKTRKPLPKPNRTEPVYMRGSKLFYVLLLLVMGLIILGVSL